MNSVSPSFEADRFDLIEADSVRVVDHQFGRNRQGEKQVWIEKSERGARFLSQLIVAGEAYAVRKEVFTVECFILREKTSGRYYFLDRNECGFWLWDASFFGARTYSGDESKKVQAWLSETGDGRSQPLPS